MSCRRAARRTLFLSRSDNGFRLDDRLAVKIWTERFRDDHSSVLLLVIFHDGNPGAPDCQTGSVQRVDEADLPASARAIADIPAPGLKILEVAAGGNLTVGVLSGQPHFQIVTFGCA